MKLLNEDNRTIHGMWIGEHLSPMELLTLSSFTRMGHVFELWAYDEIRNALPEGVVLRDASQIVPRSEVFCYDNPASENYGRADFGKGSYAGFSDIFRYSLLHQKGGWWSDMDVTCLRPLDFASPYVFRAHSLTGMVGNVMKCPARSDLMALSWAEAKTRITSQNTDWCLPFALLSRRVQALGLHQYVVSADVLGDDVNMQWYRSFTQPETPPPELYTLHWCNEALKSYGLDKSSPVARSFYQQLLTSYGVETTPQAQL